MTLTLPIVQVTGKTLPEVWEKAVVETWERGAVVKTQYDKAGDAPSRDALCVLAVADPMSEPRIHRAFPGGIVELEAYRQEVVDGIHDHWVNPAEGKWEYTYHERLAAYKAPGLPEPVRQLDYMVEALAETPHTRRAQAITWKPWEDAGIHDPACLQRIWCRIFGDVASGDAELVMNVHMRSNDAFKAAFMNMYAFTDLQHLLAEQVSARLGRHVRAGQYTHISDSFHIYGSYFAEFEGFLRTLEQRSFEERTYATSDVADIIDEARHTIAKSLREEAATGRKGL